MRYEIDIAYHNGNIVWDHGQFTCGEWPNVKMFSEKMNGCLRQGEKFVADNCYHSINFDTLHTVSHEEKASHIRMGTRHESCNVQLKMF